MKQTNLLITAKYARYFSEYKVQNDIIINECMNFIFTIAIN